jgi:hypothetical protein
MKNLIINEVLENVGVLLQFPSPEISQTSLVLPPQMVQGPTTFVGAGAGAWQLPDISKSEPLAGGSLVGRVVRIHNGTGLPGFNLTLTAAPGQTFGLGTGVTSALLAGGGSIGLFGQYSPSQQAYYWSPLELNGVNFGY